jgi:hypothetical protein
MTRGLSDTQVAAEASGHVRDALIVDMLLDSGTVRGSLCGIDLEVGGELYRALNTLRSVDDISEDAQSTEGLRFQFDGLNPIIITLAAQEPYRGRPINLYRVYLTDDYKPMGATVLLFPGLISTMGITEEGGSASLTVQAEHILAGARRSRPIRYSSADQELRFPDDKGFEYVEQMTEVNLIWPRKEFFK